jgi:hypothetical protein
MAVSIAASGLVGCGLVPDAFPLLSHTEKKALFSAVIRGVQCEIRRSVVKQLKSEDGEKVLWLKKWSALINMQLQFDETLSFNPGVSLTTPNLLDANVSLANGMKRAVPQSYAFGVGGQVEGERSRTEIVEYFWPFDTFIDQATADDLDESIPCYHAQSFFIVGDLGLRDWLDDVLEPYKRCAFLGHPRAGRSDAFLGLGEGSADDDPQCSNSDVKKQGFGKDNPIRVFSHQVQFKLTLEAGATPAWKLVRIESPISSPLFRVNRKDTSTLLITLGSADTKDRIARKEKVPSKAMEDNQNALRTGVAVQSSLPQ